MPKSKQTQLTEPVKNYLKMRIAESGSKTVPLESERTLCPRFGISRPTLHRAIEELLAEGWCIKLSGRRGIFSNPEKFMPGIRNIGLLNNDCYSPSFICVPVLYSFIREFNDMRTFINFTRLYSDSLEERIREIAGLHLAGLLFYMNASTVPLLKALIAKGIPTVATVYYDITHYDLPEANFEPFNYRKSLENRLDLIRRKGYRRVVMISDSMEYFMTFQSLSDNLLEPENFILGMDDIPMRLPQILAQYKPDVLISDGGYSRYQILFETLEHYSGEVPELMLYPQVAEILQPALLKRFRIHYMDDTKIFETAGRNAAMKLKKLMKEHCRKREIYDKKKNEV